MTKKPYLDMSANTLSEMIRLPWVLFDLVFLLDELEILIRDGQGGSIRVRTESELMAWVNHHL